MPSVWRRRTTRCAGYIFARTARRSWNRCPAKWWKRPCCRRQLNEYFAGVRREFDLPLAAKGTAFQQAVWAQLLKIPYGEVRTYGQLAAALGNPKASRAVGSACHRNPLCIVVPCHRVIGADGSLTGYAEGLDIKEYLLELERF